MTTLTHWTSVDLESLPENGSRYEIIDGELYVSKQPHAYHQAVCTQIASLLNVWSKQTRLGHPFIAPGLVFAEDNDVAPDVIWISNDRLATSLANDGKFHTAPELVIEVLAPGAENERRDRETKLKLYSRRGADEYWIIDWRARLIETYRRESAQLSLIATLKEGDELATPRLPGFSVNVAEIFEGIP